MCLQPYEYVQATESTEREGSTDTSTASVYGSNVCTATTADSTVHSTLYELVWDLFDYTSTS